MSRPQFISRVWEIAATLLTVLVNEARWKDNEARDTFCTVTEGILPKGRTPIYYDKTKPIFSQEYELYVTSPSISPYTQRDVNPDSAYLSIQLRQTGKKVGSHTTIMGQHQLQIAALPERGIEEGWMKLYPAQEQTLVSGQLQFRV